MTNYLIEKGTNYSYLLKAQTNPTFESIRKLSVDVVNKLSNETTTSLWEKLENGLQLLDDEVQLSMYMYAYGQMHWAKLIFAFEKLPELPNSKINIIDWGCGQGLATIAFNDFLKSKGNAHTINSVTLIEPSEYSLKRAALHVNKLFPKTKIRTVNKYLNEIIQSDISTPNGEIIIHLFSNILDIDDFNINDLSENLKRNESLNFLICVSPYINEFRNERLNEFIDSFEDLVLYEDFNSKEWRDNWTIDCKVAMICNFVLNKSDSSSPSASIHNPILEEPPTDGGCYLPC